MLYKLDEEEYTKSLPPKMLTEKYIMEKINLDDDVHVIGFQVMDCNNIGAAFDKLVNTLPGGFDRSYYGISEMTKEGMIYKATALQHDEGEPDRYQCQRFVIEKGDYLAVTLKDWRKNLEAIKEIFTEMFQSPLIDKSKSCIEWYKNDEEMICMVKMKQTISK